MIPSHPPSIDHCDRWYVQWHHWQEEGPRAASCQCRVTGLRASNSSLCPPVGAVTERGSSLLPSSFTRRLSPCPPFSYSPTHPSISLFFLPSVLLLFTKKLLHYTSREHPLTLDVFFLLSSLISSSLLFFLQELAKAMLFQIIQLLKLI